MSEHGEPLVHLARAIPVLRLEVCPYLPKTRRLALRCGRFRLLKPSRRLIRVLLCVPRRAPVLLRRPRKEQRLRKITCAQGLSGQPERIPCTGQQEEPQKLIVTAKLPASHA